LQTRLENIHNLPSIINSKNKLRQIIKSSFDIDFEKYELKVVDYSMYEFEKLGIYIIPYYISNPDIIKYGRSITVSSGLIFLNRNGTILHNFQPDRNYGQIRTLSYGNFVYQNILKHHLLLTYYLDY